jgi:cell division protein FtsL
MEKRISVPTINQKALQQIKGLSMSFVLLFSLIIIMVFFIVATINIGSKVQTLKNNLSSLNARIDDYSTKIQSVNTELEFYKESLILMEEN